MFLADDFPKIVDMGIAGIDECFAAICSNPTETFIGVTVTGDDMVSGNQLFLNPTIEPRQHCKTE